MDGGGRLDQPLMRSGLGGAGESAAPRDEPVRLRAGARSGPFRLLGKLWPAPRPGFVGRWRIRLARLPAAPGFGIVGCVLLLGGAVAYGAVEGDHVPQFIAWAKDARDAVANAVGFRIVAISLSGAKEVSREEILTTAGVTGRASLLFLDADAARARLMANPWIADAAVLKLYPDRLQITVTERQAFALWQKDGRVSVIAADGTVLEPYVERRYIGLPLVVGAGAQRMAKDFLALLDRFSEIRAAVRASILVANRRWDLRLDNGLNIELPENDPARALARLVALERDKRLLSRDITSVDLRLPDRVTVKLSDAAAQAREEALQANKKKRKGGDA